MKARTECRKCEVCKESSHHWMPVAGDEFDFECKHCDAEGFECGDCYEGDAGDGTDCINCDGEGVLFTGYH